MTLKNNFRLPCPVGNLLCAIFQVSLPGAGIHNGGDGVLHLPDALCAQPPGHVCHLLHFRHRQRSLGHRCVSLGTVRYCYYDAGTFRYLSLGGRGGLWGQRITCCVFRTRVWGIFLAFLFSFQKNIYLTKKGIWKGRVLFDNTIQ